MVVINVQGDNWLNERQSAVLLHCLGPEGQCSTCYQNKVSHLMKPCQNLKNIFSLKSVCWHADTFRQCVRCANETVNQYITELRVLAESCGFRVIESELTLYSESLTLDKAMTITCQVEAAVKSATLLLAASTVLSAPVMAVDAAYAHFQRKKGGEKHKLVDLHTM